MSEFNVDPKEAPREQQFRIYDAASAAWRLLYLNLPPEEVLAAVATMAAMDIGVKLFGPEDEAKALDYVRKTATELLPEVRRIKSAAGKTGGALMDIIVDIDGTLADCSHRLHWITTPNRKKDWDAFFAACAEDRPIMPVIAMVSCIRSHPGNKLIFCSGRPERTREATREWLRRHCLPMEPLYMRPDHDHRDDDALKREMLAKIRADGFDPVLAIEDRKRVVDMWRAEGLVCAQVAAGDF